MARRVIMRSCICGVATYLRSHFFVANVQLLTDYFYIHGGCIG